MDRVRSAITVKAPPQEVYGRWRDFERLPTFMMHLRSVTDLGGGRSHWVAEAPVTESVEWDAEIVEDVPGEALAWRSVEGASVSNVGKVAFTAAPGDRGTEIRVELAYQAPGGAVGRLAAKLLGEEPSQQVDDDLRRFKQILEVGEVVRSDGSPEGTRARRQATQEPAQASGESSQEER